MLTLSADFDPRRDAEMAVEHIVQEHGIDMDSVTIMPVSQDNSAGVRASGSDIASQDDEQAGATSAPALSGPLRVSVEVSEDLSEKVLGSFATYGGVRNDPVGRPDLDL